MMEERLRRW